MDCEASGFQASGSLRRPETTVIPSDTSMARVTSSHTPSPGRWPPSPRVERGVRRAEVRSRGPTFTGTPWRLTAQDDVGGSSSETSSRSNSRPSTKSPRRMSSKAVTSSASSSGVRMTVINPFYAAYRSRVASSNRCTSTTAVMSWRPVRMSLPCGIPLENQPITVRAL